MQRDYHYYGTYVLARAAGINAKTAQIIASSAQFVDDSVRYRTFDYEDGSSIVTEVTAHHAGSVENLNRNDQRYVWIPFHFLPGNIGEAFTERLICVKNSAIARAMVDNAIRNSDKPNSPYLIGVTAHVYADTFAHYGFSGVSSTRNRIINDSISVEVVNPEIKKYIEDKARDFLNDRQKSFIIDNIRQLVSSAVEIASGALGHGTVATYPDRPYLKWKFEYELERRKELDLSERDNRVTYLEASEALFDMFRRYVNEKESVRDDGIDLDFSDISDTVLDVIRTEGDCDTRINAWRRVIRKNRGFRSEENDIPSYLGDEWYSALKDMSRDEYDRAKASPIYKFYNAASYHRTYVLKDLLPENGINVV